MKFPCPFVWLRNLSSFGPVSNSSHVPKCVLFPRVAQTLFNHKDALTPWAAMRAPTCKCEVIRHFSPEAPVFAGHVVFPGTTSADSALCSGTGALAAPLMP